VRAAFALEVTLYLNGDWNHSAAGANLRVCGFRIRIKDRIDRYV
jgi:hypothetical protein